MKKVLLFTLIYLMVACDLSDCDDALYILGPPVLGIEFIDEVTEENIFTSGVYQKNDIEVVKKDGTDIAFKFIEENDYNIIRLIPYSNEEINEIYVKIGEQINAKIKFEVAEYATECFSNFYIENVEVENYTYELNEEIGVLEIKI